LLRLTLRDAVRLIDGVTDGVGTLVGVLLPLGALVAVLLPLGALVAVLLPLAAEPEREMERVLVGVADDERLLIWVPLRDLEDVLEGLCDGEPVLLTLGQAGHGPLQSTPSSF